MSSSCCTVTSLQAFSPLRFVHTAHTFLRASLWLIASLWLKADILKDGKWKLMTICQTHVKICQDMYLKHKNRLTIIIIKSCVTTNWTSTGFIFEFSSFFLKIYSSAVFFRASLLSACLALACSLVFAFLLCSSIVFQGILHFCGPCSSTTFFSLLLLREAVRGAILIRLKLVKLKVTLNRFKFSVGWDNIVQTVRLFLSQPVNQEEKIPKGKEN